MTATGIATTETVKPQTIGLSLWGSFTICFLCNMSAGLISTLMSVYLPSVVQDLTGNAAEQEIGRISAYIQSLYIGGWAIGGFFWGFISDRIGRVKALALSAGSFGAFALMISFVSTWEHVVMLRLFSGLAVGGILVITPTLLFEIWPAKSRSVMIGIDSIGFPVGIFSSGMLTVLVANWRAAFLIGVLPIVLAIVCILAVKDSEEWKVQKQKGKQSRSSTDQVKNLVTGSIIFGSMLIGLWGMFSWIPTWVQSLLGATDGQQQRGIAMMLLGAGGLSGGFASGMVSNMLGVRKSMIFCFTGCIVTSALLFGLNQTFSAWIYIELGLLSFFFGVSQGLLSFYIPQLFPIQIRGTYTGICFNIGRVVTAAAVLFVGFLVAFFDGYSNTLLAFAAIFVLGLVTMILSKENTSTRNAAH